MTASWNEAFGKHHAWLRIMIAAIGTVFLLGGSARADTASLLVLRPAAMIWLGIAVLAVGWEPLRRQPVAATAFGGFVVIHILHLVPLPPELWSALPGRERAAANLAAAQIELGWRPLSLVPFATWNSLFALAIPLGFWIMAARFKSEKEQSQIVLGIVCLAVLSTALGVAQVMSGYSSPLYFYRITNSGLAVGLFANRNHNGYFLACAIPMMGYLVGRFQKAGGPGRPAYLALAAFVLFAFAGVALAGSRGALVLLLVGIATLPLFVAKPARTGWAGFRPLAIATAIATLCLAAAALFSPTNAISRAVGADLTDELRFTIWPIIFEQVWTYFPAGAGMGTFVETYQIAEPAELLRSSYVNHAHNDWLELLLDGGLAGAVLLGCGTLAWLLSVGRYAASGPELREKRKLPLLGLVVIGMLGLGSILDYPLRTPSLAALFALAVAWTARGAARSVFSEAGKGRKG